MGFIYDQLIGTHLIPYPKDSYAGKTVIVTGSNTGLGKEAARHYVRLGASRVILAVRNLAKGEEAKRDIEASQKKTRSSSSSKENSSVIQVWKLDMASFPSVKSFAERVSTELDRLDIFIANAGLAPFHYAEGESGMEITMTVNVISTFYLAALILPKLRETGGKFKDEGVKPVFTITASGAHKDAKFPQRFVAPEGKLFEHLNGKENFEKAGGTMEIYPLSKMLEIFGTRSIGEISPLSSSQPVTVNCVDPGMCRSELSREAEGMMAVFFFVGKLLFARTTEQGSRTLVHAASAAGKENHGKYISNGKVAEPSTIVTESQELRERVWREICAELEGIEPGVVKNFG